MKLKGDPNFDVLRMRGCSTHLHHPEWLHHRLMRQGLVLQVSAGQAAAGPVVVLAETLDVVAMDVPYALA